MMDLRPARWCPPINPDLPPLTLHADVSVAQVTDLSLTRT
jgi:hypothetical protein